MENLQNGVPWSLFLQVLLILGFCSTNAFSAECRIQLCSRQYTRALEEGHIQQGPNFRFCHTLHAYYECVRSTARSCRGDLSYHSIQTMIATFLRNFQCDRLLEKGPPPSTQNGHKNPHRFQKNPKVHQECVSYHSTSYSHCALFGDPHLRTFYDELQTCSVPGAWPLLDNPHLAVQVTNDPVGQGSGATAVTKITVIIRQRTPCAQEKIYEAQTDYLPGVFMDGTRMGGQGVRIREENPGKHVEIHLRYISTRVVIRQVGKYLTFAVKMPSAIALQGAESGETLELCVRGCPRREQIDFQRVLQVNSDHKLEAVEACRALNITDFYLDACVFDLMTTGDGSFSAAARDAMLDAGAMNVLNGTLHIVPRSLESSGCVERTVSPLLLLAAVVLMLLVAYR